MDLRLKKDKRVSRTRITKPDGMGLPHYHEEYELYYMLRGSTTYFIGDEIYSVERGNFVFIPKWLQHKTDYGNGICSERILVSFHESILSEKTRKLVDQLSSSRIHYVSDKHLPVLEELLYKLEEEFQQEREDGEVLLDLYIQELLALLCRYRKERAANIHDSDRIVYRISEYISSNFEQEITLEKLGQQFAISESYLSRKFKSVSGMGLNEYVTYVRIANAERMLRETDLSVTEIAEKSGFNGSNYFSAVFKRIKGVTPLLYRKKMRQERGAV